MKTCKRCKVALPELDLTEETRKQLSELILDNQKLQGVKFLMGTGVTHENAKIIMDHMITQKGVCGRCDYNFEGVGPFDCPDCGAFNYNIL